MFLLIIVGLFLMVLAMLYFGQGNLIYIPRQYFSGMEALKKVEVVSFELDGKKQHVFLPKRRNETLENVWWVFGGNGSVALDWIDVVESVPSRGQVTFVLFDYPGYGMNEGSPNPRRIADSIDLAIPEVAEALGLTEDELVARSRTLGHSLGAAVAFDFANRYDLRRVIAISPFTTMEAMAERTIGKWAAWILSHRYDNEKSLESILESDHPVEITIVHGEEDKLIPPAMSQSLGGMDPTGEKIKVKLIPEAGHNDIIVRIAPDLPKLIAE